ncbi:MAG: lactate utilization protein, partial [Methanoculleus sp.]
MANVTQQMAKATEYSAVNLTADAGVDVERWSRTPDEATLKKTAEAIEARNVRVVVVDTAEDALRAVVDLQPEG